MTTVKPTDITLLSTEDAVNLLAALDPDHGWTLRKLKDRIDRTGAIRPQKVGQTNVFTARQLRRFVRLGYREWPAHHIAERVYGIDAAGVLLGSWLDETISHRQMEYLMSVKRRIHAAKIGRTLVFTHAELRRFLRAERARRAGRLGDDEEMRSSA